MTLRSKSEDLNQSDFEEVKRDQKSFVTRSGTEESPTCLLQAGLNRGYLKREKREKVKGEREKKCRMLNVEFKMLNWLTGGLKEEKGARKDEG